MVCSRLFYNIILNSRVLLNEFFIWILSRSCPDYSEKICDKKVLIPAKIQPKYELPDSSHGNLVPWSLIHCNFSFYLNLPCIYFTHYYFIKLDKLPKSTHCWIEHFYVAIVYFFKHFNNMDWAHVVFFYSIYSCMATKRKHYVILRLCWDCFSLSLKISLFTSLFIYLNSIYCIKSPLWCVLFFSHCPCIYMKFVEWVQILPVEFEAYLLTALRVLYFQISIKLFIH